MSSKRQSTAPSAPKPPTTIHSTVTIAEQASLTGAFPISISANSVIHPRTKLTSAYGPVTIGKGCIICERAVIGLQNPGGSGGVVIADGVVIDVRAVVEGDVGERTIVEVGGRVGKGAVVGKHCKIGPMCTVQEGEVIPDFTVIYGDGLRRVDRSGVEEMQRKVVARQVEVLRKLIPSNLGKFQ